MNDIAIDNDFRLGKLLVEMNLVTQLKVEQAATLSSLTTLPLGKLLSLLGYLPDRLIKCTIEAQSMLRDRLIQIDLAKKAMDIVKTTEFSFMEALEYLGYDQPGRKRSRLGELLTDAKKVQEKQLEFGLKISDTSGLPLGQVFILMNKITDDLLRVTLSLQRELRHGHIEREKVIARLSRASKSEETINTLPSIENARVKIGEIFLAAGLCGDDTVNRAIEEAKTRELLLGEYLVQENIVSQTVLGLALRLQSLVWQNKITMSKATEILKETALQLNTDQSTSFNQEAFNELDDASISLFSFLKLSGYLSDKVLSEYVDKLENHPRLNASVMKYANLDGDTSNCSNREVIKLALKDPGALRFILNEINPQDKQIVDSGCVLHKLVEDEKMSLQEALFNFSIKRSGITIV